jgi:16S rRNA (guanine(966)-N(2))-methyltransferase RsmD
MRISAGELKGRKIGAKKLFAKRAGGNDLRPTSAKVREAIFDILRGEVEGASFLDLYAGMGTVGMEALSRGAGKVVFVESVRPRAKAIGEMIEKIGLHNRAEIHCEQAEAFLKRASRAGETFDIIFADPPYASDEIAKMLPLIDEYGILDAQGAVLCEHATKLKVPDAAGTLILKKQYRYGDTMLALYRKNDE